MKKTGDETVDSMFDEVEIKTVQMVKNPWEKSRIGSIPIRGTTLESCTP